MVSEPLAIFYERIIRCFSFMERVICFSLISLFFFISISDSPSEPNMRCYVSISCCFSCCQQIQLCHSKSLFLFGFVLLIDSNCGKLFLFRSAISNGLWSAIHWTDLNHCGLSGALVFLDLNQFSSCGSIFRAFMLVLLISMF